MNVPVFEPGSPVPQSPTKTVTRYLHEYKTNALLACDIENIDFSTYANLENTCTTVLKKHGKPFIYYVKICIDTGDPTVEK